MEDTLRRSSNDPTEPFSDNEFDSIMEKFNPNRDRSDEEDMEVDNSNEKNDIRDVPDTDDDGDDDDVVEVNTPTQPLRKSQPSVSKESRTKPGEQPSKEEEADDEPIPPISRKQRGKLIQKLTQDLQNKEEERQELENLQRRHEQEERRLSEEIEKALGSDEAYERALEAGLRGDEDEGTRARIWKANRSFYNKLVSHAEREFQKRFTVQFWNTVNKLDGVDKAVAQHGTIPEILQHLYLAGTQVTQSEKDEKIQELEDTVANLKGMLSSNQPRANSQKRSPLGAGGNSIAPEKGLNWRTVGLDRSTGLPTDEMEALVEQYGQKAFTDPNILKLLKR